MSASGFDEEDSLFCPECGYHLRGISSDRCPECGLVIDRTIAGRSQLPWVHRKTIGRWRAFWRTVIRVNFRPSKLGIEANRPVSFSDARLFRHICILIAWASAMAWVISITYWNLELPNRKFIDNPEQIVTILVFGAAIWLFLLFITGIPSYFFHPKVLPIVRQNRAIALSYYASAALAWAWILGLCLIPIAVFSRDDAPEWQFRWIFLPAIMILYAALLIIAFLLWRNALTLLKQTTQCSSGRWWTMGLTLPASWIVSAALFLLGVPALSLFVAVVLVSLLR